MNNHIGPVVATTDQLKAIDCQPCGYVHLDPLPTQDELDRLYADEYYQEHNAGWFEKEAREQWYWFAVYNQRLVYAERLFLQAQVSRLATKKRMMRIYDYGAGAGWFAHLVDSCGHWAYGYEPNLFAREYALKHFSFCLLDNKETMIKLQTKGENKVWDFINTSFVLEHLLDPLRFLQDAYYSLKRGGILCVIVPNEFNPLQRQLKNYTPVHAHHLNYFTPDTLKDLAQKAGFEIVRNTSTFPIEWIALHGLNYIKHPRLGKVAHWLRMAIEWSGLTLAPERWERMRDRWAARGVGRETELWLRKA